MSARSVMIAKLLSVPAIVSAVNGEDNIHPSAAPQDAPRPYILVHKPAQDNRQLVEGSAKYPRSRLSFEIIGALAGEADDIGELLYEHLEDVTNETIQIGGSPPESFTITIVPADFDTDDAADIRNSFRRIVDFYMDWRRA